MPLIWLQITRSRVLRFAGVAEDYKGPFAPLILRSMPDLNPSFEKFAKGLQALSEGRAT